MLMSAQNLKKLAGPLSMLSLLLLASVATIFLAAQPAAANHHACFSIASSLNRACFNDTRDDFWEGIANCTNIADPEERGECIGEVRDEVGEAQDECREVRGARRDLCEELGENRYESGFDPDSFTAEFNNMNPYFPLAVGNMWVFEGEEETITVEVLDETKSIEGVTCIVVNDVGVVEDGSELEDTDDWYGQALNGDVFYCGEISLNFEAFEGDDPAGAELVDIDGSWKAGREGAQAGTLMFADPVVGTVYRQELAWSEAEDAAEVISTTYRYGDDPELDFLVPQELAELLCDGDCLVTRDFTPIEPDANELKYYAPGVGQFLEVAPDDEEIVQLVACNTDPRCADLPEPEDGEGEE
jgi:hypothetical protein